MDMFLMNGSLGILIFFMALSLVDGVLLHLIIYKFPENADSKKEHLEHTARAILFIPILLLLYYWNLSGPWLWLLSLIITVDLIIEALDILEERKSRSKIGGLSSGEYLLHLFLTTTRVAALALALANKPKGAWLSSMDLPAYTETFKLFVFPLVLGAIFIALLHIVLIFKPNLISQLQVPFHKRAL